MSFKVTSMIISIAAMLLVTQAALATNESSYQWGLKAGFGTYQCRVTESGCDGPGVSSNDINTDCIGLASANSGGQVTNSTACMDGFIAGYTHWCSQHAKDCIKIDAEAPKPNYNQTGFVNQTTSDNSYNEGLKFGHEEYQKCDTTCLNLNALGLECYTSSHVDNATACRNGFAKVWLQGGQTQQQVAMCILSGHTWDAGGCQSGRLVGITSPRHCDSNGTCDSGGWTRIPQK